MTLPASGALSLSAINTEFGRGTNLNAYRGTGWYTDAGGSGTFSTGTLSISEFYNKRLTSPQFSFTIASNQTNANLRTLAVNAGWNQSSKVVATINSGVYISANSTGTPGLTINGSFPGGLNLINNGFIVGMGGAGGVGKSSDGGGTPFGGSAGSAGGGALSVSSAVTITNNGTIGGGGGGGGGGGTGYYVFYSVFSGAGGGGGGGRTGATNSSGGSGGVSSTGAGNGSAGGAGTSASAGAAGTAGGTAGYRGGNGGAGGSWGAGGSSGAAGTGGSAGLGGGGSGYAVSGNASITWAATGTRLGSIS